MKKSLAGSLIGIAVVVAIDTVIRVAVSVATEAPVHLFRYDIYPGILIGFSLSFLTLFSSFAGAALTISYADVQKKTGAVLFIIWLIMIRYGQIHYVLDDELFTPILSLIISLIGAGLAWKFFLIKKTTSPAGVSEQIEQDKHHKTDTTASQS